MAFATSYIRDAALLGTPERRIAAAAGAIVLAAFPFLAPGYWVYFAGLLAVNIVATAGLDIIMGYTGLLSLGHAAFMGVGAYTVALAVQHLGLPFYLTIPMGGLAAAVVGVIFGLPALRIRGLYLVIATLAAQFILNFVFVNWESVTRGDGGIVVPPATLFGFSFNDERRVYLLVVPVAIVMVLASVNLFRSRVGRAFIAIREKDLTAEVLGVNIVRYKLMAFAIGSFYAGVAGGLMAYFARLVNPEQYGLVLSVFFLAAVIVGGMGSALGSVLGAVFMTILPEVLRESLVGAATVVGLDLSTVLVPFQETLFGLLMVLFLIFEPQGLARVWHRIARAAATWPMRD
jgi:branched-chain amino acid transport system permease protein